MPRSRSLTVVPVRRKAKAYRMSTMGSALRIQPRRYSNVFNQQASMKLRVAATVASNAGGVITFAYSNNPSSYQDWSSVGNLYDEYKATGIKFQYIPYLPNDTSTVTGFLPLYSVYDPNSTSTPLTSINDAIQYENMKVYNMYRPWKRYVKLRTPVANAATVVNSGGYMPTASGTATSCVAFYGEGFDISTSYGSIIVTIYLKLRNRK